MTMIIINLLLSPNSTEMRQEVSPEKIPVFFFRFVLFTPKTCLRVNRFSCESFTSCVQTCTYTHWVTRAHQRWWQDKTLNICSQSVSEVDTDFVWLFSEGTFTTWTWRQWNKTKIYSNNWLVCGSDLKKTFNQQCN